MARSLDGVYTWLNLETPPGGGGTPFKHPIVAHNVNFWAILGPFGPFLTLFGHLGEGQRLQVGPDPLKLV